LKTSLFVGACSGECATSQAPWSPSFTSGFANFSTDGPKMKAYPQAPGQRFEYEFDLQSISTAITDAAPDKAWQQSPPFALHAQINSLVERIEEPVLRAVMLRVFYDLARLIEYLRIIDAEAGVDIAPEAALKVLELFHEESRDMIAFINNRALRAVDTEKLFETFDGAIFAIGHELTRVFKEELSELNDTDDTETIRGKLNRARGLLCNCLQQSFVTIAQVFNPFIDSSTLFNDVQVRHEQSLILFHDLSRLIELCQAASEHCDIESAMLLIEKLEQFRGSSMHFLMYRDWKEYEREVDIVMSAATIEGRVKVLGRFTCYLETLLGHVKMRGCLASPGQ
jgi:hypothetical protein